jgi:hypothetical protein
MKEEVPPALVDAHVKSVGEAINAGKWVDATYNLDKTGIAGTGTEKDTGKFIECSHLQEQVQRKTLVSSLSAVICRNRARKRHW